MNEQWQELKETIIELRDNDGTGTQQEVCKFLVNYMGILEKQMQEPCGDVVSKQAVLDIVDSYSESKSNVEDVTQDIISDIMTLPPADPQIKTGHWINAKVGKLFPSNDFKCSGCGNILDFNGVNCGRGDANYCPNCGAKMQEIEE